MQLNFKKSFISFARDLYKDELKIDLHRPVFEGNEGRYILEAIKSNYVSSVGKRVDEFGGVKKINSKLFYFRYKRNCSSIS